ncbi:hypothetical protein ARTSIC4J27_4387 [Pseudarthrobacter siccitolerans]|uniref:Uncharacterized protein n=1 Tax=Pseudarthrobacter siccitolerans TaxID=861266 RepID=A0A024H8Z9_9MICC|nr:hypothetical protein ARTSIC4J27_4387 [Pseudarthrobacter siccitolerans]
MKHAGFEAGLLAASVAGYLFFGIPDSFQAGIWHGWGEPLIPQ